MTAIFAIIFAAALTYLINDVTQILPSVLTFLVNLGIFAWIFVITNRFLKKLKEE